jgi:hypothetical protein
VSTLRFIAPALVLLALSGAAGAAPLNPGSFTSLGSFAPAGAVSVDTSPDPPLMAGGAVFSGVISNGVAVFCFDDVDVSLGIVITVAGTRPLAILSKGDFEFAGTLTANATLGTAGAGGYNGATYPNGNGSGPGGGGGANFGGGGGGGFGGAGGAGNVGNHYAPGGAAYGNLLTTLQGGSGGGRATYQTASQTIPDGGGGGGAVEFGASGSMTIAASAIIECRGAPGISNLYGTGGGAGGGVLLHAMSGTMAGALNVAGADGGDTSVNYNGGGGGGGGRVHTRNLSVSGTITASGGVGGIGGIPVGTLNGSPGTSGSVTSSTVGPALSVSLTTLGLGTTVQGTPGSAYDYALSATYVSNATTVAAPSGVELSLDQSAWSATLNFADTGSWGPVTIYARLTGNTTPGAVSGVITHTSTGAASANVAVSGTVTPSPNLSVARNGPTSTTLVDNDEQGPGGDGLVILDVTLAAGSDDWDVTNITFSESGSADGQTAVNYLALFEDANNDGQFDAAVDTLATAAAGVSFSAANGTYTATLTTPLVSAGTSRRFFLVTRLAGAAIAGETLHAEVSAVTATSAGSGVVAGVPTNGPDPALEINPAELVVTLHGPLTYISVNNDSQGPNGDGHVILDVTITSKNDTWTVSELTFNAGGTGDSQSDISFLALYLDDGNDSFDGPATDTLATAAPATGFDAPNGSYTAVLDAAVAGFTAAQSKRFFLVAKLAGSASSGETFQAALDSMVQSSSSAGPVTGLPTAMSSALVIDSAVLTVSAGPGNPADFKRMRDTAGFTHVLGQFRLTANNDHFEVSGLSLTAGSGDWPGNLNAVEVYQDDGNGTFDAADTLLFSGPGQSGSINCTFGAPITVADGTHEDLWIVLQVAGTAGGSPSEDFWAEIVDAGDVYTSTAGVVLLGTVAPVTSTLGVVNFAVTSFVPPDDDQSGGAAITIIGSGFALPVTLTIGGNTCPGTAVVNAGGTEITGLFVPPGTGQGLPIVLTTNDLPPQTLTQTFSYTFVIAPGNGGGGGSSGGGGGCAAGPTPGLALLAPLALLLRRRRIRTP